jgi:hypothetical protein
VLVARPLDAKSLVEPSEDSVANRETKEERVAEPRRIEVFSGFKPGIAFLNLLYSLDGHSKMATK